MYTFTFLEYSLPYTLPHHLVCIILCCFTPTTSARYHLVCLSCATGIGLTLNNVQYTNNSVVNITNIGTDSAALLCTTTSYYCCFSGPPPGTHWYFPNGSRVDRSSILPYYRGRTDAKSHPPGRVILHRNPGATTTGVFRCEILDARGAFQSIYVGIYTATTGEFRTLKSDKFVEQEPMSMNVCNRIENPQTC